MGYIAFRALSSNLLAFWHGALFSARFGSQQNHDLIRNTDPNTLTVSNCNLDVTGFRLFGSGAH